MLPQRIKLASTLFMVAAAFGVCTGIFFKARGTLTWPLFVGVLLVDALRRGASDIHVEPYEKELRIRFRIDGLLYDVRQRRARHSLPPLGRS